MNVNKSSELSKMLRKVKKIKSKIAYETFLVLIFKTCIYSHLLDWTASMVPKITITVWRNKVLECKVLIIFCFLSFQKSLSTEPETKINVCVVFHNYKWHVMTICSCNVDWSASNCRIFQSVTRYILIIFLN